MDQIEKLVNRALGSQWVDKKGNKNKLGWEDILLVTPYNYQVALLQDRLGTQARVGSVDLFQGQEAPLVIVSLCASTGSEAPRGLSFLLNKNRLNVAISRAKCLALIVGSPTLGDSNASTLATMELLNVFYRLAGKAKP